MSALLPVLISRIRDRGPITFAEFMELALYDPEHGYYTSSARRSGRGGDFFTSVDVGPLFGEMIAVQLDEMWHILRAAGAARFDLVEAGAGDGRLSRDILDAAAARHPDLYEHVRVTLIERSAAARAQHREVMGPHAARLEATEEFNSEATEGTEKEAQMGPAAAEDLNSEATEGTEKETQMGPATEHQKKRNQKVSVASVTSEFNPFVASGISGAIIANELLDALPVHVVTMTADGLREVLVGEREGRLVEVDGPPADPAIPAYLARMGATLEVGSRAEVGLEAERWVRSAARSLALGFVVLFDYGHEARELFSPTHARGTLMAYRAHTARADDVLQQPGVRDLTAHVNLTAVRQAGEAAGLVTVGIVDQTYFLASLGIAGRLDAGSERASVARRLAAKTLVMPGGLGSTMKVMVFARGLGRPALGGLSSGRLT